MLWDRSIISGLRLKHGVNSSFEDVATAWMNIANHVIGKYFHETIELGVPASDVDARYDTDLRAIALMYCNIHVAAFGKSEILYFIYATSTNEKHFINYAVKAYQTLVIKTISSSRISNRISLQSIYERSHLSKMIENFEDINVKQIHDPELLREFIFFVEIFF